MKVKKFEAPRDFMRDSRAAKEGKDDEAATSEARAPEGDPMLGYIPTSEPSKTDVDSSDVVY